MGRVGEAAVEARRPGLLPVCHAVDVQVPQRGHQGLAAHRAVGRADVSAAGVQGRLGDRAHHWALSRKQRKCFRPRIGNYFRRVPEMFPARRDIGNLGNPSAMSPDFPIGNNGPLLATGRTGVGGSVQTLLSLLCR